MVPECQHFLYNGRRCGRIPATGQPFCPAHRSRRRRENDTFDRELDDYTGLVEMMDIPTILDELQDIFARLYPRIPRSGRVEFHCLAAALSSARDRIREVKESCESGSPPAPPPPNQAETMQLLREVAATCFQSNRSR